jgi:hypothetical protein
VTFGVEVGGIAPFNYQWRFKGDNIAGETNSLLTLTNMSPAQSGNYSVVITNSYTSVTSAHAALTVVPLGITSVVSKN